ncbi:MAG TPA: N-acetyltransferase [Bdellovibrionota bacterium]|jgi:hypothetical protein
MQNLKLVSFEPGENKSEYKKFIELAWTLNKSDPNWVSPLRLSVQDNLDTKKNPFYQHAKIRLWNAYKDGKHVGRIAAIVDKAHNDFHQEKTGFWGFYEAIDDASVSEALFREAEAWLKSQSMEISRGPANPSLNHECGMLISGFDTPPYLMMTHNPQSYPAAVEKQGYKKAKDLLAFNLRAPEKFEAKMQAMAEMAIAKGAFTFRPINMKDFDNEIMLIKEIYNAAWEKNWGFVPMNDEEFLHMARSMKDIVWPDFCLIAMAGGKPIGFSLALPDINQVLKNIPNGKLLPFGIFKLLRGIKPSSKKINRLRVITLGVRREWRSSGVGSVLYFETYKKAREFGLWGGEASWILEDNKDMLTPIMLFGKVPPYKTYRIYDKNLQ